MPPFWMVPLYQPIIIALGGFITLTNVGASYDTTNAARGLGVVQVDFTNSARIDWGVSVNKIGTGTQDWQLWNESDSVELGVISDAGGAGNKSLTGAITTGLPTGVKIIRIRVKSSVSADDPLYYGGWVRIS